MSFLFFLLSLLGVAFSAVGLYEFVTLSQGIDAQLPFCEPGSAFDCAKVAQSAYGTILGAPLGSVGIVFYLWLAFFALLVGSTTLVDRKFAKGIFVFVTGVASLASVYLFIVTKFVIGSMCPICIAIYILNFILLAAALIWSKGEAYFSIVTEAIKGCFVGLLKITEPGATAQLIKATLLFIGVSILCVRALPDFMLNKKLAEQAEVTSLIEEWKAAPLSQLVLNRNVDMLSGDFSVGPEKNRVEIVEYSDMECPACRAMHPVLKELQKKYPHDIRITFKNFPLDKACNRVITQDFHQLSCDLAEIARCAGEQGKFFESLNTIMEFPALGERDAKIEVLNDFISNLKNIDSQALEMCRTSKRQLVKITSDIEEGIKLELQGTPAIFINQKLVTQISEAGLKELVEEILKGGDL